MSFWYFIVNVELIQHSIQRIHVWFSVQRKHLLVQSKQEKNYKKGMRYEDVNEVFLVSLLLTLKIFHTFF